MQLRLDNAEQIIQFQKLLGPMGQLAITQKAYINGKARVMLGMPGSCGVLLRIGQAEFIEIMVKRLLLGFQGPVAVQQRDLQAVIFPDIRLQFQKRLVGLLLHTEPASLRIFHFHQLHRIQKPLRDLIFAVDQNHIVRHFYPSSFLCRAGCCRAQRIFP